MIDDSRAERSRSGAVHRALQQSAWRRRNPVSGENLSVSRRDASVGRLRRASGPSLRCLSLETRQQVIALHRLVQVRRKSHPCLPTLSPVLIPDRFFLPSPLDNIVLTYQRVITLLSTGRARGMWSWISRPAGAGNTNERSVTTDCVLSNWIFPAGHFQRLVYWQVAIRRRYACGKGM